VKLTVLQKPWRDSSGYPFSEKERMVREEKLRVLGRKLRRRKETKMSRTPYRNI